MELRRLAALTATTAIVLAACSSNATPSPAASSGGAAASGGTGSSANYNTGIDGKGCTVGVSWNNFQQPRWAAHDKPNIQKTVEASGGKYIDADANLSTEQQRTDIT